MKKIYQHIQTFKKYRGLIFELVSRDLKTKYRRSVLGLVWSLLNPLLMMFIIAAVFSTILDIRIENFAIYLLTGQVIFNFFSESTSLAMISITSNASLIQKVYVPKYIFPLSKIAYSFVNLLFSLIAIVIMLIVTGLTPTVSILAFPLPLLYITIFAAGVGLILASLTVFFRDIMHLYGVLLQAWMYLTPIIYPITALSENLQSLMNYNPLYHYIDLFRRMVMYGNIADLRAHLICIVCSIVTFIIGMIVFYRKQDKFILYI